MKIEHNFELVDLDEQIVNEAFLIIEYLNKIIYIACFEKDCADDLAHYISWIDNNYDDLKAHVKIKREFDQPPKESEQKKNDDIQLESAKGSPTHAKAGSSPAADHGTKETQTMTNQYKNGEAATIAMVMAQGIINDLNNLKEWLESEKNPPFKNMTTKEFFTEIQIELDRLECIVDHWEKGE